MFLVVTSDLASISADTAFKFPLITARCRGVFPSCNNGRQLSILCLNATAAKDRNVQVLHTNLVFGLAIGFVGDESRDDFRVSVLCSKMQGTIQTLVQERRAHF